MLNGMAPALSADQFLVCFNARLRSLNTTLSYGVPMPFCSASRGDSVVIVMKPGSEALRHESTLFKNNGVSRCGLAVRR